MITRPVDSREPLADPTAQSHRNGYLRCLLALTLALVLGFPDLGAFRCRAQSLTGDGLEPDWTLSLDDAHHALASNPALARLPGPWSIRLATARLFGLSELQPVGASAVYPLPSVALLGGLEFLGLDGYREMRLTAGFGADSPLPALRFGLRIDAHVVAIPGYDRLDRLSVAPGWTYHAAARVRLSAHVDPLFQYGAPTPVDFPRSVVVGLLLKPTDHTSLAFDLGSSFRDSFRTRAGAEWWPVHALRLRGGYTTAPTSYGGGVGLRVGRLAAEAGATRHAWLGWTRSLGLAFRGR